LEIKVYNFNNAGRTAPLVFSPRGLTQAAAYIPWSDNYPKGRRTWMNETLPGRVKAEFNADIKMWTFGKKYTHIVANALAAEYGNCEVILEVSTQQKCTKKCKGAKPNSIYICTCVCGGEGHSGGWPEGWKAVGDGELLVNTTTRQDTIIVTRTEGL
jgi:hypothetical protein